MSEQDRRHNDSILLELMSEFKELVKCQQKIASELEQHVAREEAKLDGLLGAFPDNDPRGHREYHDSLIAAIEQRRTFQRAVIEKSLAGLVWIAIVWIAIAIWQAFKHSLGLS